MTHTRHTLRQPHSAAAGNAALHSFLSRLPTAAQQDWRVTVGEGGYEVKENALLKENDGGRALQFQNATRQVSSTSDSLNLNISLAPLTEALRGNIPLGFTIETGGDLQNGPRNILFKAAQKKKEKENKQKKRKTPGE